MVPGLGILWRSDLGRWLFHGELARKVFEWRGPVKRKKKEMKWRWKEALRRGWLRHHGSASSWGLGALEKIRKIL